LKRRSLPTKTASTGRGHIIVNAAPAHPAELAEGVVVPVEHHLLGLARISPHQEHPTVAEPDVGDVA
jgi:hypothetical protein